MVDAVTSEARELRNCREITCDIWRTPAAHPPAVVGRSTVSQASPLRSPTVLAGPRHTSQAIPRQFLRLVSWNVNGLRAVMRKDPSFESIVGTLGADVLAIQETKLQAGQVSLNLPGYHQTWSYAERKGYSGTAVFSRLAPKRVINHIGCDVADDEGRVCALEFDAYWFVNVYTPNAQDGLRRIETRLAWDARYRSFLAELAAEKPVITCGDFNVAHNEIDLKNPGPNRGNPGFSDEERESFTQLLASGFTDTFRSLYPNVTDAYSWWSYRARSRERNVGWRIDYFLVSDSIASHVVDAAILDEVYGSDHCPVELLISL